MADERCDKTEVVRLELRRVALPEFVRTDVRLLASGLLRGLDPARTDELLGGAVLRRFPPGAVVFDQGQPGGSLYWVTRGEAWLALRHGADLVDLGPVLGGDVFGEGEVLGEAQARAYLARASGELDVAEFPRALVQGVARKAPALLAYLEAVQSRRQSTQTDMLAFLNRW